MRIAHVAVWHYPRYRTCGPVIYLHSLAKAQRAAGDDAYVVCGAEDVPGAPPYTVMPQRHDGIEYVKLFNRSAAEHDFWRPEREAHDPQLHQTLTRLFELRGPDIVHIHNFAGLSFDIVAAAQACGARVVTSLHNYFPLCSRDDLFFANAVSCGGPMQASCSRCLGTLLGDEAYRARHQAATRMLNACDALLPVSTRVQEIYAAHGVDPGLMEVERIGSAVAEKLWAELGQARVAAARARAGTGLDTTEPLRVITFGAGLARKGALALLQAARRLAHPEHFRISVYGALDQSVREGFLRICEPHLLERITFVDAFDQAGLPEILGNADLAVLTPRWEDNGPQTVFESLAAGLPVLASRMGGIPDVVHDNVNGLLVDEGDVEQIAAALTELAADRGRLEALRAAIEPPRSISEHAETLRQLYTRLAPEAAGRAEAPEADPPAATGLPSNWTAVWPHDIQELGDALALSAAYRQHVPALTVGVLGDVQQAGGTILQMLASAGVPQETLPDVVFNQVFEPDGPSIVGFRETLTSFLATRA